MDADWTLKYGTAWDVFTKDPTGDPTEIRCDWLDGRFPGVEVFVVYPTKTARSGRVCGRYHGKEIISVDSALYTPWEVAEYTHNALGDSLQG